MSKTNTEHRTSKPETGELLNLHRLFGLVPRGKRWGTNENSKNQTQNTGMKTPNPKLQTPKKLQIPGFNTAVSQRHLGFGAWIFSGAWCFALPPIVNHKS